DRASERAGTDESVLVGEGTIGDHRVAVVVGEFGFLAGSIGAVAATRVVSAFERASAERLPVLVSTSSGGTRMQEGTPAFVLMADIARAMTRHREAGLLSIAYLRHPTTGGVFATWGSLAPITWAEPGALVGFLGPKVFELLNGRPFPTDVQTAENLAAVGVIDEVVAHDDLRTRVAEALGVFAPASAATLPRPTAVEVPAHDVWD